MTKNDVADGVLEEGVEGIGGKVAPVFVLHDAPQRHVVLGRRRRELVEEEESLLRCSWREFRGKIVVVVVLVVLVVDDVSRENWRQDRWRERGDAVNVDERPQLRGKERDGRVLEEESNRDGGGGT